MHEFAFELFLQAAAVLTCNGKLESPALRQSYYSSIPYQVPTPHVLGLKHTLYHVLGKFSRSIETRHTPLTRMALRKLISSQEQKVSNGSGLHYHNHARTRKHQSSEESHFESQQVRTCDCAINSSRELYEHLDPSSVCLMAMVEDYLDLEASEGLESYYSKQCSHLCNGTCTRQFHSALSCKSSMPAFNLMPRDDIQELDSILRSAAVADAKLVANVVWARKEADYEIYTTFNHQAATNATAFVRMFVLNYLKRMGYNAGICKSERETDNGFPLDEHEYMDVIVENSLGKNERVFVDLRFRSQFKIARPSSAYKDLLQMLPKVYVGNAFTLQRIVRLMCQAAKTSLESQGMHVPPWRRLSFMHAKWFSSYTRTTEVIKMSGKEVHDQKRVLKDWNSVKVNKGNSKLATMSQNQQLIDGSKARSAAMIREWQPSPVKTRSSASKIEKMAGALAMAIVEHART